jgi:hypothetical protein
MSGQPVRATTVQYSDVLAMTCMRLAIIASAADA